MFPVTDALSTGDEKEILIIGFGFMLYTNGLLVTISFIFKDNKVKEPGGGGGVLLSFFLQPYNNSPVKHNKQKYLSFIISFSLIKKLFHVKVNPANTNIFNF